VSSQDIYRRPPSILKKSIAEVIENQRFSERPKPAAPPAAPPSQNPRTENMPNAGTPDAAHILRSIGEVPYSWELATDTLSWGENIADILPHIPPKSIETGMGFAAYLKQDNETSRYDAVKNSSLHDKGDGVAYQIHYGLVDSHDQTIWIEDTGRWFAGSQGDAARAHGVIRVVTQAYEQRLAGIYEAKFDHLTGLHNREHMNRHLEASLDTALRDQKSVAVLLANIDNLGIINRAYGYDIADEVIAGIAKRLRRTMRGADILARYAGNKFAFILESCNHDQMPVAAKRFLAAIEHSPIETSAGQVHSSLRMGGAIAPRNGRTAKILLQHAEEALELTRVNAAQPFLAYTESLVRQDARQFAADITRNITTAIDENRIELALQPVVDARTRQITFHEALIRIRRKDGTLMDPESFLPTAERIGLIKILDRRILDLSLAYMQKIRRRG